MRVTNFYSYSFTYFGMFLYFFFFLTLITLSFNEKFICPKNTGIINVLLLFRLPIAVGIYITFYASLTKTTHVLEYG